MKAHVATGHGRAQEVFKIVEVPLPSLGLNDVLVKVHYTSVNPLDCKIRQQSSLPRPLPLILGFDLLGEIVAVGAEVTDLEVGMWTIASPSAFRPGANAAYIAVDAYACQPIPSLNPQLAALPLAGITAYESLCYRLHLEPTDTVLIHAGAGGVGHIAIQLAKAIGCTVITTASQETSVEDCKGIADHVINYKANNLKKTILELTDGKGILKILDTVGGNTFMESLDCLQHHGHMCTILPSHYDAGIGYANLLKNITLSYQFMGAPHPAQPYRQREVLAKLLQHIDQGTLKLHISKLFPFEELPTAHIELEQGHTMGKLLIKVAD